MAGGYPVPSVETRGRGAAQIVPCNWYLSTASVYVYTHLRYLANPPWIQILTMNQINSALAGVTEYARLARACCQVQPISGERGEVEEERGEAGRGKEKEEKDS